MPKGFSSLREEIQRIEERKQKALEGGGSQERDWTPSLWFKLPESASGKTAEEVTSAMSAVIRPLEEGDDVAYALVHPVTVPDKKWPVDIPCRDQDNSGEPCPGCEAGLKRKVKGWINVIWRDAPDFPQDEDGRYNTKVDYESLPKSDKVAILSSGPQLFGRLDELDEDLDGITNYELSITRKGLNLATTYDIKRVKGTKKSALSAADKKLAEDKPDLSNFIRIPEYDEWVERAKGVTPNREANGTAPSRPVNPLASDAPANIFG
jgi:hypothetical protein